MRLAGLLALTVCLWTLQGQTAEVATFTQWPTVKKMAIGPAYCYVWSQLTGAYPVEVACWTATGSTPFIAVPPPSMVMNGGVQYCEDGKLVAQPDGQLPTCNPEVNGGSFQWIISPAGGTMYAFHLVAWPNGGVQAKIDGIF